MQFLNEHDYFYFSTFCHFQCDHWLPFSIDLWLVGLSTAAPILHQLLETSFTFISSVYVDICSLLLCHWHSISLAGMSWHPAYQTTPLKAAGITSICLQLSQAQMMYTVTFADLNLCYYGNSRWLACLKILWCDLAIYYFFCAKILHMQYALLYYFDNFHKFTHFYLCMY